MARLFADEDFPQDTVRALRRLGHDVLATREAALANLGTPDSEILRVATADGRAVLTLNRRHYGRLHMQRPGHAGIVVYTVDSQFDRLAQRIHSAISGLDTLAGMLIRITRPGPGESPG